VGAASAPCMMESRRRRTRRSVRVPCAERSV
jgi:hypothetical protein